MCVQDSLTGSYWAHEENGVGTEPQFEGGRLSSLVYHALRIFKSEPVLLGCFESIFGKV